MSHFQSGNVGMDCMRPCPKGWSVVRLVQCLNQALVLVYNFDSHILGSMCRIRLNKMTEIFANKWQTEIPASNLWCSIPYTQMFFSVLKTSAFIFGLSFGMCVWKWAYQAVFDIFIIKSISRELCAAPIFPEITQKGRAVHVFHPFVTLLLLLLLLSKVFRGNFTNLLAFESAGSFQPCSGVWGREGNPRLSHMCPALIAMLQLWYNRRNGPTPNTQCRFQYEFISSSFNFFIISLIQGTTYVFHLFFILLLPQHLANSV